MMDDRPEETPAVKIRQTHDGRHSRGRKHRRSPSGQVLDSFVGVWKAQKSENFDNYLKVQGVGYVGRAIFNFVDTSINIDKTESGLKVVVQDHVTDFQVGIPQPLYEHPVTKRRDLHYVVTVDAGRLVTHIYERNRNGADDKNGADGKNGADDKNGADGVGESRHVTDVITLEVLDADSIKQTLQAGDIKCFRWYSRDPASTTSRASGSQHSHHHHRLTQKLSQNQGETEPSRDEREERGEREENQQPRQSEQGGNHRLVEISKTNDKNQTKERKVRKTKIKSEIMESEEDPRRKEKEQSKQPIEETKEQKTEKDEENPDDQNNNNNCEVGIPRDEERKATKDVKSRLTCLISLSYQFF